MTPDLQGMLDAAFSKAAAMREARNLANEVSQTAMANRDFDAVEDAAAREKHHWDNLNGALAVIAILLDGLGYDMKPAYPDAPSPCPFRAEAELERWLERRRISKKKI